MAENLFNRLCILRNLLKDEVFGAYNEYLSDGGDNFYGFLNKLYESGYENNFRAYIQKIILTDDNAFARSLASRKNPSRYLKSAYLQDLALINGAIASTETRGKFSLGEYTLPLEDTKENVFKFLADFYAENGYGKFIENAAFTFENGGLVPVKNAVKINLAELKDYTEEKQAIDANISAFINNLPCSNMLLYGDKGTGKSSTVHAMLNKYSKKGLRLIDLNTRNMVEIPAVVSVLEGVPLKFILFIDDLALSENDEKITALKTALEGSVSGGAGNVMIVATSNRRHIVKENFSDRQNAVHERDIMEEQLSLSDRFGLTVMFSSTNKEEYLSIVSQLAKDAGILALEGNELSSLAERWALVKGGRSPRRAKQFVDFVYSRLKLGVKIDF